MKSITFVCGLLICLSLAGIHAEEGEKASLRVETDIAKAEVYLNGIFQGLTPVTISPIEKGVWQLTVKKDGYYQESYTISIAEGEQKKLRFELVPITGTLVVENAPPNAEFEIDGKTYTKTRLLLPEGIHTVTMRAFGYTERTADVDIDRYREKILDGKLEKAPFAVSGLRTLKKAFNPENPANLGKAEIAFTVSAPGTGNLVILDPSGETVQFVGLGPFTAWKQTVRWEGLDEMRKPLPDGDYRIILKAQGTPDGDTPSDELEVHTAVRIDGSIVYPRTDSFAGIGSTGPVVSAHLMSAGGALIQADVLALPGAFNPGLTAVIGLTPFLEGGLRASVLVGDKAENSIDVSAGLKTGLKTGNLRSALSLRYSAVLDTIPANVPVIRKGLAFGPSAEYEMGRLTVGGNIEGAYGNDEGLFDNARFSVSEGIAVRYTAESISLALYLYGEGLDTLSFGLSPQWILPSTNLALSAQSGYQISTRYADTFFFRFAFGVLF